MGINIIGLFINYRTSYRFFYPILLLFLLTIIVTFHSRIYKTKGNEEVIRKVNIKVENTEFLKEVTMIKSGDFSGYISEMQKDMEYARQLMKNYEIMVKKYHKYDLKSKTASKIRQKHKIKMRDYYLQNILDDYETLKKIKMDLINNEVYEEWKNQKTLEK
ncbi:hypothetical protein [Ferroplasma sp.]|uniref:hypothetical protein n=1 Tax=Ferroplasma sp. TaxID=2591003 RepID=UPI00307FBA75